MRLVTCALSARRNYRTADIGRLRPVGHRIWSILIRDYPSRKAGGCPTSKCQHDFSIYFRFAHGISKRMSEGVEAGSVSGGVAGFQGPGEPSRKSAGVESQGIHPEFREQPDIPCPSAIFDIFEETHVHKRRVDRHNALTRRGFQALFFPLTGDDETPPAHDINRPPLAATARNAVCATPVCHSLADDSASYLNNLDALEPPPLCDSLVSQSGADDLLDRCFVAILWILVPLTILE